MNLEQAKGLAAIKAYKGGYKMGSGADKMAGKPGASNPGQYGLPDASTELQDLIEYRNMNFAVGNIFKACYRLGHCDHSDNVRDLRKIKWFVERELARAEAKA